MKALIITILILAGIGYIACDTGTTLIVNHNTNLTKTLDSI